MVQGSHPQNHRVEEIEDTTDKWHLFQRTAIHDALIHIHLHVDVSIGLTYGHCIFIFIFHHHAFQHSLAAYFSQTAVFLFFHATAPLSLSVISSHIAPCPFDFILNKVEIFTSTFLSKLFATLLILYAVFLVELINTPVSPYRLLLAGIERMAF